ncbi:thioredoxin family protein [Aquifex sp.]
MRKVLIRLFFLIIMPLAFAQEIPFLKPSFLDLKEDLEEAKREGKYLFLMFEEEGCPFCDKMKRVTFQEPKVKEYFAKHFYMVIVDRKGSNPVVDFGGKEMTEKELAKKYKVRGTPVFVFVDHEGKTILKVMGYIPPEEFLLIGKYIAEGHYKNMSFYKFKRKYKE